MQCYRFNIPYADPVSIFDYYYNQPFALFLDSSDRAHPSAQFSFIAYDPIETAACSYEDDAFTILNTLYSSYCFDGGCTDFPFTGGLVGMFGYDLGRAIEYLPLSYAKTTDTPDMFVGVYTKVIAFDHKNKKAAHFIWCDEKPDRPKLLQTHGNAHENPKLEFHGDDDNMREKISLVIEKIKQGDIFQANIAKRWQAHCPDDFCAWTHYKTLRRHNPAPFGAYLNYGDIKIASISPERFLHIDNDIVTTNPIKGTLPADQDAKILLDSEKDRAENIMIVDLLRNDLSKICTPGSIDVTKLCTLETFRSLHHLVSSVKGTLQKGKTPIDVLQACFPGGSITGAPKIRAMEIIDELENFKRGPYCGAIGYIGFDGAMDTSIIIRTLVYEGNTVTLHAGGGITAQSNPDAENQEMNDKARAILESFQ